MGQEWRRRLRAWRTRNWLKADAPLSEKALARLQRLDETELAAAAANPAHSDAGRSAARALMEKRGGRLEAADIVVPGFVKPQPLDRLRHKFFGLNRSIRKYTGMFSILLFIALIGVIGYAEELKRPALREARDAGLITADELYDSGRKLTPEEIEAADPDLLETWETDTRLEALLLDRAKDLPGVKKHKRWVAIGYAGIALWFFTFVAWLVYSLLRRQPARILLLRKFNNKKLGKAMSNVITTELKPFGHVMTLSDKHIKRSRWSMFAGMIPTSIPHAIFVVFWLPLRILLRQFNRAKHGPAWVGSARNFRSLAKRLRDRLGLNAEVSWSSNKEAFIVRTSDQWWKEVIALLMHSADVIVVDLSEVTTGTQWELERIDRLKEWRRAVFTAHEDKEARARNVLADFNWGGPHVHLYDKLGDMHDQAAFRDAMLEALERHVNQTARLAM